jgi:hypothetical protein
MRSRRSAGTSATKSNAHRRPSWSLGEAVCVSGRPVEALIRDERMIFRHPRCVWSSAQIKLVRPITCIKPTAPNPASPLGGRGPRRSRCTQLVGPAHLRGWLSTCMNFLGAGHGPAATSRQSRRADPAPSITLLARRGFPLRGGLFRAQATAANKPTRWAVLRLLRSNFKPQIGRRCLGRPRIYSYGSLALWSATIAFLSVIFATDVYRDLQVPAEAVPVDRR